MAVTDRTGAIAADIAQDKNVTKNLLHELGVPVPFGRAVENADDAWHAACEIGLPVVVKPRNANHGRGVSLNLSSREQVMRAYDAALPEGDGVLVEEFAIGAEYRVLVVNGRVVAVSRGEPEAVVGDGVQTVRALVDELNRDPRRGEDWASPLCTVMLDSAAELMLEQQGYKPDSIPGAGVNVMLHYNGEFLTDVTDDVHPATAAACVLATRVIGLDIAGIDLIARDITQPPGDRNVRIIEVNSGPGMRMHFDPQYGKPRPVGDAIVDGLFAAGDDGRIPIFVVHGERRATDVARLVEQALSAAGRTVGLDSIDGICIGRDELKTRRADDASGQRAVLLHPDVEAAVCQTSPSRVRRDGLGFDQCDVVVLLDDGADADVRRVLIEAAHPERGVVIVQHGDAAGVALAESLGRRAMTISENDDASIASAVVARVN
jgi:cyanophycin synthetase